MIICSRYIFFPSSKKKWTRSQDETQIRKRLISTEESQKAAQEARAQRERRKYGKQVQIQKIQDRAKQKRETLEKIDKLKKRNPFVSFTFFFLINIDGLHRLETPRKQPE